MAEEGETRSSITQFAKKNVSHRELKFISDDPEGVLIKDVTGQGLVNNVFRVTSKDGSQSVIIKYGEVKTKEGLDFTLGLERQDLEYSALEVVHSIYPGGVPQPYCFDKDLQMMAMEDLSGMSIAGNLWRNGEVEVRHAKMLGKVFSEFHRQTHRDNVSEDMWKQLCEKLRVQSQKQKMQDFRFVYIFKEENPQNVVPEGCKEIYRSYLAEIKNTDVQEKIVAAYGREDCVIHADTHAGSMFVSETRVALFDWEFANLGNAAADIAFVMCSLILTQHETYEKYPERKDQITDQSRSFLITLLDSYFEGRHDINTSTGKAAFMSDLVLFLGSNILAMTLFPVSGYVVITIDQWKRLLKLSGCLMKSHQSLHDFPHIVEVLLWKGEASACNF